MKNLSSSSYFPVLVDLTKFNIIVIGAGNIATRKILNLLEFGASLKIISPTIPEEITELSKTNNIQLEKRKYQYGDISFNSIVFCSTGNPEVDAEVQKECEEKNALLNVADVPELCNFIMPATIKRGDLTISIASQGKAPFFVRETRKKLSKLYGPQMGDVVEIASMLREKLIETGVYSDIEKREKIFEEFFKLDIMKIILEQGKDVAMNKAIGLTDII